jgi:hypothetical protein
VSEAEWGAAIVLGAWVLLVCGMGGYVCWGLHRNLVKMSRMAKEDIAKLRRWTEGSGPPA